jgi:ribose 5-phosphate isomerase B
MQIFVGADHRGFNLREKLIDYLKSSGYDLIDEGDKELNPDDDFPQFAGKVANAVLASDDPEARGILICGSGQGVCMSANRFKGIRAALGFNAKAAQESRNDDDSNILCLPADLLEKDATYKIVDIWLKTPFAGATRFKRRNQEMDELG